MTIGNRILLYGATGYMGRLLAERAAELAERDRPLKLELTLAGRDAKKLAEMSEQLGFPYVAFGLETPLARAERLKLPTASKCPGQKPSLSTQARANQAVDKALANVAVVLNAAGPYAETAEPLARACMRTQTHYLDIGGEYDVWSALRTLYDEAHRPDIAIVPGAGLTVLGSDLLLRQALALGVLNGMGEPHAVRVALSRVAVISRGSAKTMLESARSGVRVHQNGNAVVMSVGALVRTFNFGDDAKFRVNDPRICTAVTLADARTENRVCCVRMPNRLFACVCRISRPTSRPARSSSSATRSGASSRSRSAPSPSKARSTMRSPSGPKVPLLRNAKARSNRWWSRSRIATGAR
jgi:short subunit dehydrogenase-like uncharacterized protein